MIPRVQSIARWCLHRARLSPALRRAAGLPVVSRVADAVLSRLSPSPDDYPAWIADRVRVRRGRYPAVGRPGLLSFITTVWNTPVDYLRPACDALLRDQTVGEFQWVVLDNGSIDADTRSYLAKHVATDPRVKFLRVDQNLGIVGGMRRALAGATGQYVLPYDSDDTLYTDAVEVVTHFIGKHDYPAALYSDEDKLEAGRPCWPYFKPAWDPVLFVNSCFIAHLGCFDRELAISLGVYGDPACDGCHDWDTFMRLLLAGHAPVHVPEMLYSWRMHSTSTAGNINSKAYVYDSHRAVLNRFLNSRLGPARWDLKHSPLFGDTPDWWFARNPIDPQPLLSMVLSLNPKPDAVARHLLSADYPAHEAMSVHARGRPQDVLPALAGRTGLVCVVFDSIRMTDRNWAWEAASMTELHPDSVAVAGRVTNGQGRIIDAPRVPGFAGLFGCPDRGRDATDPGYSAQMWKPRSVGGASTHLCMFAVDFLVDVIDQFGDQPLSWFFLGAWAAAAAKRSGRRIVYTPFLSGQSDFDVDPGVAQNELDAFAACCGDVLPDTRFYSRHFGLTPAGAYKPVSESRRKLDEATPSRTDG